MNRRLTTAGLCATVALLAAACGSSGGSSDSASSSAGAAAKSGPSGPAITIGVQAPMNGPAAYPQTGYGAEAAVKYVNEKMGGINGRPLAIDLCAGDNSPETGISCANGFVSKNRPVVYDAYDPSIGPMAPVLTSAEIPIVGELGAQGVADALPAPQAFYWTGPLETSALGSMTILSKLGKKNASLAVTEAPSSHSYVDKLIVPIARSLGLKVTASYTATTNLNFSVLAATELASKPDVAGVIALPEDGCTGLLKALRQQGYKGTIFAGSCSQFISTLGKDAEGAVVQPRLWVPLSKKNAPAEVQTQLDDFATYMKEAGHEDQQSARSLYAFAGIINLANVMKGISGEITNTSVATAMTQVKDMPTFAGPTVTCDGKQWPGRPASCSNKGIFFEVQDDGTLKTTGGDGFLDLDPSVIK